MKADFEDDAKCLGGSRQRKLGRNGKNGKSMKNGKDKKGCKNMKTDKEEKSGKHKDRKNKKIVQSSPALIDRPFTATNCKTASEIKSDANPQSQNTSLVRSNNEDNAKVFSNGSPWDRGENEESDKNKTYVQAFPFRALPGDLRNMMYDYIVLDQRSCMRMLFSCRQIHQELRGVFLRGLNFNINLTQKKEAQTLDKVVAFIRDACANHKALSLNENVARRAELNVGITLSYGLSPSILESSEIVAEKIAHELQGVENMNVRFRITGWVQFRERFRYDMNHAFEDMPEELRKGIKIIFHHDPRTAGDWKKEVRR